MTVTLKIASIPLLYKLSQRRGKSTHDSCHEHWTDATVLGIKVK